MFRIPQASWKASSAGNVDRMQNPAIMHSVYAQHRLHTDYRSSALHGCSWWMLWKPQSLWLYMQQCSQGSLQGPNKIRGTQLMQQQSEYLQQLKMCPRHQYNILFWVFTAYRTQKSVINPPTSMISQKTGCTVHNDNKTRKERWRS